MNVFLATFQAVAALLGIGIVGFWIIGRRHIPSAALGLLTSIAIDMALPCLILGNIITQFSPQTFPTWWHLPLWWVAFTIIALILSLVAMFLIRKDFRGEFAMSLFFQNGAFFPLIIITGLFGSTSNLILYLFLFLFLQPSMIFSTYSFFFRNKPEKVPFSWRRVINPMLIFTILGIIIGLAGVNSYVPKFVIMIVTLIGAMAIPLFMLILGGNIYNDFIGGMEGNGKFYVREVVTFTLVKNLLFPLVFLGLLILVHPEYSIAFIIILQAAVPPITAIPIFTQRSGGNRAITNQFIVASFLFSILSIPGIIFLFDRFFPVPG
jgi:malate permease and related proteins